MIGSVKITATTRKNIRLFKSPRARAPRFQPLIKTDGDGYAILQLSLRPMKDAGRDGTGFRSIVDFREVFRMETDRMSEKWPVINVEKNSRLHVTRKLEVLALPITTDAMASIRVTRKIIVRSRDWAHLWFNYEKKKNLK